MKKALFLAALTSLAMTSCTCDEVISSPEGAPIGFDSFIGKTTRATDASIESLKQITVYGYIGDATPAKIFDGEDIEFKNNKWEYSPVQYWTAGKNYFFTAVSSPLLNTQGSSHFRFAWTPDNQLPIETTNYYGQGTISFNNASDGGSAGNEDVVYAYATKITPSPLTTTPGIVGFAFKHALSRVQFTFKNAMGSDAYTIKVHDLTINNAAATGTLTLGSEKPTWKQAGSTSLELRKAYFKPTTQEADNGKSVVSGTKFIIPGTNTLNITFSVDLIVNGSTLATYTHSAKALPETTFVNGHSYNFVADITPKNLDPAQDMFPIEFNVTSVEDWKTETDITVTLPEHNTSNP